MLKKMWSLLVKIHWLKVIDKQTDKVKKTMLKLDAQKYTLYKLLIEYEKEYGDMHAEEKE